MNNLFLGIVIGLGIMTFLFWLGQKLSDPALCLACGSEVVRWDYSRIVCSNPKCGWED